MLKYIALSISFIIVTILIFANPFNFSRAIQEALMPWATLTLAFVAILTIVRSNIREERSKKIDRLADILEWATDIVRVTHTIETPEPPKFSDTGAATYERLQLNDRINDFQRFSLLNDHMKILSFKVDKELHVTVCSLAMAIDDLLNENWCNFDIVTTRSWLAEYENRIYEIAKVLINETTKRIQRC